MSEPINVRFLVRTRVSPPQRVVWAQPNAGFTLVEMLLVVVLLATLTGTLTVSLRGRLDSHALRIAARDLAAAVRFSISEARLTRLPHRIAFQDGWTCYRVERAESAAGSEYVPVKNLAGRMRTLAKQVHIAGASVDGESRDDVPEFLPQYPAGEGFSGGIQLANRTGETMTIEISPVTGQVRIVE